MYMCESDILELTWTLSKYSAFLACRYAGPAMQITGKGGKDRSGGSIICTASGMLSIYFFLSMNNSNIKEE